MLIAIDLLNYYIKSEIEGTIDRYIGQGDRNMRYATMVWTGFDEMIYKKRNPIYFRCIFPGCQWGEVWFENKSYKSND